MSAAYRWIVILGALLIAGLCTVPVKAFWQSRLQVSVSGGGSSLSVDATAKTTTGVYGSPNALGTLTATHNNSVIVLITAVNGDINQGSETITDSVGLSWTSQASGIGGGGPDTILIWTAVMPTAGAITITLHNSGGSFSYQEGLALAISGASTSSPPTSYTDSISTGTGGSPVSFTTTAANTVLVAGFRGAIGTPDSGWSLAIDGDFVGSEYKIVSTTQSGTTAAGGTGGGGNGGVGTSIK